MLQAIYRLARSHTTIHMSDRIDFAQAADLVIYMREGRVIAAGTHDQLLQQEVDYLQSYRA